MPTRRRVRCRGCLRRDAHARRQPVPRGRVPADRAVRLDEDQQHVGAADTRQADVHRRALPEVGAAAAGHLGDEQPRLPRNGARDRRRKRGGEEALLVVEPAQVVHRLTPNSTITDDGKAPSTRRSVGGSRRRSPCRAPTGSSAVQHERDQDGRRYDEDDEPPRCDAGEHGADRRHMTEVPEQIDRTPVEGRRGHVRVPAKDQHDPRGAEPRERAPRQRCAPRTGRLPSPARTRRAPPTTRRASGWPASAIHS